MRVQRVLMPDSDAESWTLLGDDLVPVVPVERFLAYLAAVERSPNTVKAYAHDLKDWLAYLAGQEVDWRAATLEVVAGFVAWLRLPPAARDGRVAVLPSVEPHCASSSVNRKLAAVTSFYEFHGRHGVDVARLLVAMQPAGRRSAVTSYKPFLQHVTKGQPQRRRMINLKAARPRPKVLTQLRSKRSSTPVSGCGIGGQRGPVEGLQGGVRLIRRQRRQPGDVVLQPRSGGLGQVIPQKSRLRPSGLGISTRRTSAGR